MARPFRIPRRGFLPAIADPRASASTLSLVLGLALASMAHADAPLRWGRFTLASPVSPDSIGWDGTLGIEGEPVEETALEGAIHRVLGLYARAGFPFAAVQPGRFAEASGVLTGTLRIDPGPASRVEGLLLDGAKVTRPMTASRLAGIRPGMRYTGHEGAAARDRLRRSGLFTQVDSVRVEPGSGPGAVLLRAPVREPAYTRFRGVAGVSGREARFTGLIDLELRNLAGTGREAAARWEGRGEGLTRYLLRYREPWLPLVPVGLSGSLRHDLRENAYSYTNWELAGDLEVGRGARFTLGYGGASAVETGSTGRDTRERFALAGATMDRRDAAFAPTSGWRLALESRRGTRVWEGEGDLPEERFDRTRWSVDGEVLRRVGTRWLAFASSRFLFLDSPEDSLPVYDLFAIGGAVSLRGYREEQFLTAAAWTVQTEWRLLQDDHGSAVYGFVDAALISDDPAPGARDRLDRFLLGYGVGLRQAARVGLLGVEYAAARGENPLDGRLHLRLDAAF